jgi:hypothetical protein
VNVILTSYATKQYSYALEHAMKRTLPFLSQCKALIITTDGSKVVADKCKKIKEFVEGKCEFITEVAIPEKDDLKSNTESCLRVARLQNTAWDIGRKFEPDYCLSIESDILVPPNALNILKQVLDFDDGYYDAAMITYPNMTFLGGRGTPQHWILPSVYPEERNINSELKKKLEQQTQTQKTLIEEGKQPTESQKKQWKSLMMEAEKASASGNVWHLNANYGWKKRGWFEYAYPAIGRGAILPTDWIGLGCTLMNRRAFQLASFEGYDGHGTQDLFLCWKKWYPAGIKLAVVPHVLCHHVKHKHDKNGKKLMNEFELYEAYHETMEPATGHLRVRILPWESRL